MDSYLVLLSIRRKSELGLVLASLPSCAFILFASQRSSTIVRLTMTRRSTRTTASARYTEYDSGGRDPDNCQSIGHPTVKKRRSTRAVVKSEVVVTNAPVVIERKYPSDKDESTSIIKRNAIAKRRSASFGGENYDNELESPKKKQKARAPKPEPIYIIPDVETKETTFKGRLGYACLNTILRDKKPSSEAVFCSRTCRIDSIKKKGIEWVQDLGRKNVEDLLTMIQWNEDNNIRFLRISSSLFPFASHPVYHYSLSYCGPLLARVGALAAKYGHRLTTHPGQYVQLGSPRNEIREAARRELEYHCEMLERMAVGKDGVMVVHGGGVYGDKSATLERIKKTITEELPPSVRARLVLENDELCYNAEDLLPLCEELDVPLVFDYHHDTLNPSSFPPSVIIARTNVIFARRGIRPKQHLSEPRKGAVTLMERRAHAGRCQMLPKELEGEGGDVDLMIEAKDKEQAVLHLYRIYGLQSVEHASLRPPEENETKETKGRKSAKKAKKMKEASAAFEEDEEGGGMEEDKKEVARVEVAGLRRPKVTRKEKGKKQNGRERLEVM